MALCANPGTRPGGGERMSQPIVWGVDRVAEMRRFYGTIRRLPRSAGFFLKLARLFAKEKYEH